jgi:hypothetical protein
VCRDDGPSVALVLAHSTGSVEWEEKNKKKSFEPREVLILDAVERLSTLLGNRHGRRSCVPSHVGRVACAYSCGCFLAPAYSGPRSAFSVQQRTAPNADWRGVLCAQGIPSDVP